jgi:hypothetical protein
LFRRAEKVAEQENKELDKKVDGYARQLTRSRYTLAWYLVGVTVVAIAGALIGAAIIGL